MESHENPPEQIRLAEDWEKISALSARLSAPDKRPLPAKAGNGSDPVEEAAAAPPAKVRRIILKCKPFMTLLSVPDFVELANGDIVCVDCLSRTERIEFERLSILADSKWLKAATSLKE